MGRNKKKIKWKPLHLEDDKESKKIIRKKPLEKRRNFERHPLTKSPISSEPKLNFDNVSSTNDDLQEEYITANEFQWNRDFYNQPPLQPSLFVPYPFDSPSLSLIPFSYHLLQGLGNTYRSYSNLTPTLSFPYYEEGSRTETENGHERQITDTDDREQDNFRSCAPNYAASQFVFEPWIYAAPHFNAYPWLSPCRRNRRGRYGGEGISYDRWPSRIKCTKMPPTATMNEVKPKSMTDETEKNTIISKKKMEEEEAMDGIVNVKYESNEMEVTDPIGNGLEEDETTTNFEDDLNRFAIVKSLMDELVDHIVVQAESSVINEEDTNEMEKTIQNRISDDESEFGETEEEEVIEEKDEEEQLPTELYMSLEAEQTTITSSTVAAFENNDNGVEDRRTKYADYYHLCSEMVDDGSLSSVTLCSLEGDVIVHEVDDEDASECGSEDVEMFAHRYETTAEKLYKTNQVSLAIELLSVKQDVPYDSFVRRESLDGDRSESCYTNTHVLKGFYGEMRREKNKKKIRRELHLDSGIHTSDEEAEEDKNNIVITSEDEEVLFERDESGNGSFEYQRFGNGRSRRRPHKTPLMYLSNSDSWYGCCCIIM